MRPRREATRNSNCAYFVTTQTAGRKPFFRHERWARLLLATIGHYSKTSYTLHAYVIMPDHLHMLITPYESLEKAVQLIKGGFSFRAKRELNWNGDVWQSGFTDHRVRDEEDWGRHLEYIQQNPVDAKLVEPITPYEFTSFPNSDYPQGLKPEGVSNREVRAEARTLQAEPTLTAASEDRKFEPSPHSLLPKLNGTGNHATQK